ncbi:MAG TPA: ABC transporter permease [Thermoanaerobaculia bacterium]|nr:ABC transporter permease [Thermoanaerobaculia bacterium]
MTSTTILEATRGWRALNLREVWSYRDLLYIFAWRDVKVRYRQTLLGAVWVMGQPLVTMLIFTLLFNRIARIDSGDVPYPLFVLGGVLIWNFVSGATARAGNSLLGAAHLISKVYFPRLIIPLANIVTDLVDFGIAALLLAPLMIWYGVAPGVEILLALIIVLLAAGIALGAGLWIAAMNVEYRDIRVVLPWVLQVAMFATPVVYPIAAIPERYRWIAIANPMTGVVEAFRACLLGTPFDPRLLIWSAVAAALLLVTGAFYFRRMERRFADIL